MSLERVGKPLERLLSAAGLDQALRGWLAIDVWPEIVGEGAARRARATGFDAGLHFQAAHEGLVVVTVSAAGLDAGLHLQAAHEGLVVVHCNPAGLDVGLHFEGRCVCVHRIALWFVVLDDPHLVQLAPPFSPAGVPNLVRSMVPTTKVQRHYRELAFCEIGSELRMSDDHQRRGPGEHAVQGTAHVFRIEGGEAFIEDDKFGAL